MVVVLEKEWELKHHQRLKPLVRARAGARSSHHHVEIAGQRHNRTGYERFGKSKAERFRLLFVFDPDLDVGGQPVKNQILGVLKIKHFISKIPEAGILYGFRLFISN